MINKISREKTGVPGLDELIEGGVPQKTVTLISGSCGTGKSIMGGQFLIQGAKENKPGVYVTLENNEKEMLKNFAMFDWDFEKYLDDGIAIIRPKFHSPDALTQGIQDIVKETKAQRIVIDSLSILGLYFKDQAMVRQGLMFFNSHLKELESTVMAITDIDEGSTKVSTHGVEEFISDNVIKLYYDREENVFYRGISIRKMISTDHSHKIHPLKIDVHGMTVYSKDVLFAKIT